MSFHVTKSFVPLTSGCGEELLTPSPAAPCRGGLISKCAKVEPRCKGRAQEYETRVLASASPMDVHAALGHR